jgi:plastocyanin
MSHTSCDSEFFPSLHKLTRIHNSDPSEILPYHLPTFNMQFSIAFVLSALPCILAQYGDPPPDKSSAGAAPSATGSATPGVHTVAAGNGALAYSPNTITANVGETVEFHFYPPLHSVAKGDFATPCTPSTNGTEFFSGDITTSSGQNANVFTITINDTSPIWFYCVIPTHCQGGMVGVINPP